MEFLLKIVLLKTNTWRNYNQRSARGCQRQVTGLWIPRAEQLSFPAGVKL